ncbi:MAG: hypothetical protein H6Q30_2025 [Bacteroidetes bacterium]|jgi:hypothetical protein|nr:hypothetical protein [Bacteroidota bacterium]
MIRRYIYFFLLLACVLAVAVSLEPSSLVARNAPRGSNDTTVVSGVKFSHKFHVSEAGLECVACHPAVKASAKSTDNLFPSHEECSSCHEEQINSTCGYCHLNPDAIEPRVVPARELIFSHQQHLGMPNMECKTCHADVDSSADAGTMHLPGMGSCYTCHNDRQVTNQCEACHTNFAQLLPKDHLRSDFRRFHGETTRLGVMEVSCDMCHRQTFCQECHQTTGLKDFSGTGRDLMTDPRPNTGPKDDARRTVLQRVHDLNYRFSHGVDARSRQTECASCHDQQQFCSQCHQAGGNITQSHFKPTSHMVPGFVKMGIGSGGGLHAEEARRDMENCASCHDAEGQDPVCLTCHAENGRVR